MGEGANRVMIGDDILLMTLQLGIAEREDTRFRRLSALARALALNLVRVKR